jgi:hypothetical protein
VNEQGASLAGVEVLHLASPDTKTDTHGRFRIQLSGSQDDWHRYTIRLSAAGFRPLTKDVEPDRPVTFRLRRDPNAVWTPPSCSSSREAVRRLGDTGEAMWGVIAALRLPRGTNVWDDGQNVHGKHENVCRDKECMVLSTSLYSELVPLGGLAKEFKEIHERDVHYKTGPIGAEYHGVHFDGTQSRWVDIGSDLIFYSRVSKPSADYFDGIIDSMCWMDRD